MRDRIREALKTADLTWFTVMLHWKQHRYVVWLTDNKTWTLDLLSQQAWLFRWSFDNISIWGRTDPNTGVVYIDVGTTTDDLLEAHLLKKFYGQKCFWDTQNQEEVF
jgi:hypothetical protein